MGGLPGWDRAAVVVRQEGFDHDRIPGLALGLDLGLTLALMLALAQMFRWGRDRDLSLRMGARLASYSSTFTSPAYGQGVIAVGWPTFVGFIVIFGSSLRDSLFPGGHTGQGWVLLASITLIWVGMILPYIYWPRWAMPAHARGDNSPFQIRMKRRRDPTLRRQRRRDPTLRRQRRRDRTY